jgi:hypothetical protein
MGSARQIANRRHTVDEQEQVLQPTPDFSVSVEEIVRYLRQQNDVVVRRENGEFLVNARFKLPLEGLISRANRMRARQGKPEFRMADHTPSAAAHPTSANGHSTRAGNGELRNGHPIFWDPQESAPGS